MVRKKLNGNNWKTGTNCRCPRSNCRYTGRCLLAGIMARVRHEISAGIRRLKAAPAAGGFGPRPSPIVGRGLLQVRPGLDGRWYARHPRPGNGYSLLKGPTLVQSGRRVQKGRDLSSPELESRAPAVTEGQSDRVQPSKRVHLNSNRWGPFSPSSLSASEFKRTRIPIGGEFSTPTFGVCGQLSGAGEMVVTAPRRVADGAISA
jgi:hypothetical protein